MSSQPGHVSLDVDLPPKWYPLCGYITPISYLYHALVLSRRVDVSDHVQDILGGIHAKSESLESRHVRSFFVDTETFRVFSSVTALEKLHAKHALPGFTDRSAEEKEIEAATTDITKVCNFLFVLSSVHLLTHLLFHVSCFGTGFPAMSEINSKNWLRAIPCLPTFVATNTA